MDFFSALHISAYGMRAQSGRMRIIAENLANADSVSPQANGDPYRRQIAAMSSTGTGSATSRGSTSRARRSKTSRSAPSRVAKRPAQRQEG